MTSTVSSELSLQRDSKTPLSRQIAAQIKAQIQQHRLRDGQRLASVRELARTHGLSAQTVVEAYSFLVAGGHVVSRRGAGYFVAERAAERASAPALRARAQLDPRLLGPEMLSDSPAVVRLGGGGMTAEWVDHVEIEAALRKYARGVLSRFGSYGSTRGYEPLRQQIARRLGAKGIQVRPEGTLLTNGATQALDLLIRLLSKEGQTVLLDDPGYFQTAWALRTHGVRVVGVPRTVQGPDPAAFERLCAQTQAKLFFTQSALQNPTGSVLTLSTAYELLRIAERHGVQIVEDDVSGDLAPDAAPRLAMLDQLDRVVYVGSFSKTLSPSLRVGYVATNRAPLMEGLAQLKLVSTYASCEPNETIVHSLVADGHYERHVRRLQRRLQERAVGVLAALERLGFEMAPGQAYVGGSCVWVRHRSNADAMALTDRAAAAGILLAPGCAFRPAHEDSPYFRFVLPLCTPQALAALERLMAG